MGGRDTSAKGGKRKQKKRRMGRRRRKVGEEDGALAIIGRGEEGRREMTAPPPPAEGQRPSSAVGHSQNAVTDRFFGVNNERAKKNDDDETPLLAKCTFLPCCSFFWSIWSFCFFFGLPSMLLPILRHGPALRARGDGGKGRGEATDGDDGTTDEAEGTAEAQRGEEGAGGGETEAMIRRKKSTEAANTNSRNKMHSQWPWQLPWPAARRETPRGKRTTNN
ncbi:hypothetical protein niasHT_015360 [Heterodera trifolii]|uniref:Uncharacterized protein n=1 Tax=Heterodera trifolii TaxID=157864 RepID=A0ABD2KZW4_9BILA